MLVAVDINRLFLVSRALGVRINYKALFDVLREYAVSRGEEAHLVGFSIMADKNKRQADFLRKLADLGMEMHLYDAGKYPVGVTTSCIAYMVGTELEAGEDGVLIVSDADELIPVTTLAYPHRSRLSLCFFSSTLSGEWAHKILRDQVPFLDLADYSVMRRIVAPE